MIAQTYIDDGLALAGKGDFQKAALLFCQAIELDPRIPGAYQHLGEVLLQLKFWDEAQRCFCKAIELKPHYPEAYNHLGTVLKNENRPADAEKCYRQAIEQRPDYAEAFHNLGNCLKFSHRFAEAESCYLRALELHPGLEESCFSLATLYLIQGQYEKGWPLYKARFKKEGKFRLKIPLWHGEDLAGCKILLFYEQGFGDMIQFSRYIDEVAKLAPTTVWIQQPLARLLANTQKDFAVCTDGRRIDPSQFDYACSLFSLPVIFQTSIATIPRMIPYIRADQEIAVKWRQKIAGLAGGRYKVGVVWAGNPLHSDDQNRSIPLNQFSRIFGLDQIFWVSLQVGDQSLELAGRSEQVFDCSGELIDFAETAGVIANLDLVIAVDTAAAHLAGAMGKKAWLLLPFRPDWRWGLEGEESPWYPTMRLFRQHQAGDWPEVLERVTTAFQERI